MFNANPPQRKPLFTIGRALLTLLSIVALGGLVWLSGFEKRITITEAEAQNMLDAEVEKYLTQNPDVTIDYATLVFAENHLTLKASGGKSITTKYGTHLATVALTATGDPDYRNRSIYFNAEPDGFDFTTLELNGEDPLEIAKRSLADLALRAPGVRDTVTDDSRVQQGLSWLRDKAGVSVELDEAANDTAIKLSAAAAEAFVERYRMPAERFMESLVISLLEDTPLYTLDNNWKESAAAVALKDIGIEEGVFTATISGWQIVTTVFFGLLFLVTAVGFTVAIMRGGAGGLAGFGGFDF